MASENYRRNLLQPRKETPRTSRSPGRSPASAEVLNGLRPAWLPLRTSLKADQGNFTEPQDGHPRESGRPSRCFDARPAQTRGRLPREEGQGDQRGQAQGRRPAPPRARGSKKAIRARTCSKRTEGPTLKKNNVRNGLEAHSVRGFNLPAAWEGDGASRIESEKRGDGVGVLTARPDARRRMNDCQGPKTMNQTTFAEALGDLLTSTWRRKTSPG